MGSDSDCLRVESLIARHTPMDGPARHETAASGVKIYPGGRIEKPSPRERMHVSPAAIKRSMTDSFALRTHFIAGLGPKFDVRNCDGNLDFDTPFARIRRIRSLFDPEARLTDPTKYLSVMNYRAKYMRHGPSHVMKTLTFLCRQRLDVDTSGWMEKGHDYQRQFDLYPLWQKRMLVALIDICRHMTDAFPKLGKSIDAPGLLLLQCTVAPRPRRRGTGTGLRPVSGTRGSRHRVLHSGLSRKMSLLPRA